VDGGDGLHICTVAANTMNETLLTSDKGVMVGQGLTRKRNSTLRNVTQGLKLGWILWNGLGGEK